MGILGVLIKLFIADLSIRHLQKLIVGCLQPFYIMFALITCNKEPLHASRLRRETLLQRWLPNPSPNRGGETLTQVKGGERSNLNDKSYHVRLMTYYMNPHYTLARSPLPSMGEGTGASVGIS